jgi:hypothetical protein
MAKEEKGEKGGPAEGTELKKEMKHGGKTKNVRRPFARTGSRRGGK